MAETEAGGLTFEWMKSSNGVVYACIRWEGAVYARHRMFLENPMYDSGVIAGLQQKLRPRVYSWIDWEAVEAQLHNMRAQYRLLGEAVLG